MRSFKSFLACLLIASISWATGCQSAPTTPAGGATGAPAVAGTPPVASPSQAAGPAAQTEIQTRYDAMTAAMKAKDIKGYLEVLHENFKMTNKDGKVDDRKKTEEGIGEALKNMEKVDFTFKVKECVVKDNTATVTQEQTFIGTMKDQQGKPHTMEAKGQFTDVWSKTPTGWKLMEQKEVSSTMMVDGKSLDQPAPTASGKPDAGKPADDKSDKPADEKSDKPADDKSDKGE